MGTSFSVDDFKVGTKFRLYKIVDIQANPNTILKGDKKYTKGHAFCRLTVKHIVDDRLVGVDGMDSNEGFCIQDRDFGETGFFIIPESRIPKLKNEFLKSIINTTKTEISEYWYKRKFYFDKGR